MKYSRLFPRFVFAIPVALVKNLAYPDHVLDKIQTSAARTTTFNAGELAVSLGSPRVMNMILLGAMSREIGISESVWRDVISEGVPAGTEEINLKAFMLGREQ